MGGRAGGQGMCWGSDLCLVLQPSCVDSTMQATFTFSYVPFPKLFHFPHSAWLASGLVLGPPNPHDSPSLSFAFSWQFFMIFHRPNFMLLYSSFPYISIHMIVDDDKKTLAMFGSRKIWGKMQGKENTKKK